ncbi:Maternal effect embryo arrest protein [Arachis hypogaea]|nr:Maternal effect embryo arrest protein [Arachis hypogaea]
MALFANHPFEPISATACSHCEAKKCSKLQESRNALRQAVKLLETKINEVQAQNVKLNQKCEEERARAKADAEEKLKKCNARVSLENEELLEAEKKKVDKKKKNLEKERKKAAKALKAVEAKKSRTAEKEMQIAKVEAEKAEEYRTRLVRLEKEANEAKTKLAHKYTRFGVRGLICPVLKNCMPHVLRNGHVSATGAMSAFSVESNGVTSTEG